MASDHELNHIEPYLGSVSTFYTAHCSCGWISDDRQSKGEAKSRWREHESGELEKPRPQTNMVSPPEGWDRKG